MERIERSWALVKSSWSVLRADKKLALFPVISALCVALSMLAITGGFLAVTGDGLSDLANRLDQESGFSWSLGEILTIFLAYFISVVIATYFNAALVGATLKRLRGGDPTFRDGLRLATSRIGPILGYSVIAATIGTVLQLVRERAGLFGMLAAGALNLAWGVGTFLVVPVLVAEDVGPVDAIRRSGELLKKTWGEQIAGTVGLGIISTLITIPMVVIGVLAIVLVGDAASRSFVFGAVGIMVMIGAIVAVIFSALNAIYKAALYEYAAGGIASGAFGQDALSTAFRQK